MIAPDRDALQRQLDGLLAKHKCPGAAVGVLVGDDLVEVAGGVTNVTTQVPVRTDTLFLIQSVTKVWTATLVMQLVDEGLVELDAAVRTYLPDFTVARTDVAEKVTVRQLLHHTSGWLGDAPEPDGWGDEALAEAVRSYATLPQLHELGAMLSYSNSAYNVAGRLVEVVRGESWEQAIERRLAKPLGLTHLATFPEQALMHVTAIGHDTDLKTGDDTPFPTDRWCGPRSSAPCGGTLAMRVGDLVAFARMHRDGGVAADGTRVLSAESVTAMQQPQFPLHDPAMGAAWGLGWDIARDSDPLVIGHGGDGSGQHAQLIVIPQHRVVIAVLTNGGLGKVRSELTESLVHDIAGVDLPSAPSEAPEGLTIDASRVVGRYGRDDVVLELSDSGDGVELAVITSGEIAERAPGFTGVALPPLDERRFLLTHPQLGNQPTTISFLGPEDGPATHASLGLRVLPRLPDDQPRQDA